MSPDLFLTLVLAPLCLLVMLYVTWPLLRRASDARPEAGGGDARALNREIVAERRAQLDRELALLPPDSGERERLILEFSSVALSDLEGPSAPARNAQSPRWITAAILAGLLVAGPLAFYRLAGAPDAVRPDFAQRQDLPRDLPSLVAELERRLQAEPDAADGWLLLGRTRMALGDLPAATVALEKALALDSPVPALAAQIRVDLADAIAQASGTRLAGRPWDLIQQALKHDGGNQKALALAGAYQVTQGNRAGALTYWQSLLVQLPPGSEQHTQIAGFVADLQAGRNPGAATPPGQAAAADVGPVLRGRVELAAPLEGRANAADTVFIAVRGVDDQGQPVGPPAAVLRLRVADLPRDIELSDRQAMSPAARLSDQQRIVVIARISRSGNTAGSSGDLEGRSGIVAPDAKDVRVLIDRVLP